MWRDERDENKTARTNDRMITPTRETREKKKKTRKENPRRDCVSGSCGPSFEPGLGGEYRFL